MTEKETVTKLANAPVNRVLPTHELSARQRRKKAVHLNPEPKPEAPRAKAGIEKATDSHSLDSFFSQFPGGKPIE